MDKYYLYYVRQEYANACALRVNKKSKILTRTFYCTCVVLLGFEMVKTMSNREFKEC